MVLHRAVALADVMRRQMRLVGGRVNTCVSIQPARLVWQIATLVSSIVAQ